MAKKITYTDEPLGDMKVVADFFPRPPRWMPMSLRRTNTTNFPR